VERGSWHRAVSYLVENIEDDRLGELGDRVTDTKISQPATLFSPLSTLFRLF